MINKKENTLTKSNFFMLNDYKKKLITSEEEINTDINKENIVTENQNQDQNI